MPRARFRLREIVRVPVTPNAIPSSFTSILESSERVDRIELEVWQDSGTSLDIRHASLELRPLADRGG